VRIRALGVVVVLALSLAGCGRDEEASARTAIADSLMTSGADFALTAEQAECVADGLVGRIGVEQLQRDGVLTDDLESEDGLGRVEMSSEHADRAADVMQRCADLQQIFTSAMPELPEESRRCVDEELTDEVLHAYVASVLEGRREQGERDLAAALRDCVRLG